MKRIVYNRNDLGSEMLLENAYMEEVCESRLFRCKCDKPKDHEGVHECKCEGSWDDEENIYHLPNLMKDRPFTIRL